MTDKIDENCKLDANESPFSLPQKVQNKIEREIKDFEFNRYPDSNATELKKRLAKYTGLSSDKLLIGNGSDELLLMIMTAFLAPDKKAVISKPTFGMYEFYADLIGNGSYNLSLKSDFSPNWQEIKKYANKNDTSLIVFCSPNNPTGKDVDEEKLEEFIKNTDEYILLDEAYYEFSWKTLIELINKYDNLILTRTFSKAFAIASLRIGYLAANKKIIEKLEEVRSIYNSDSFSQKTASLILDDINLFEKQWKLIRKNRDELFGELKDIKGVTPYSSKANFILFNTGIEEKSVYKRLKKRGIKIRFLKNLRILGDSLRVTVGSKEENSKFLSNLKEILSPRKEVAK